MTIRKSYGLLRDKARKLGLEVDSSKTKEMATKVRKIRQGTAIFKLWINLQANRPIARNKK